MEMIVEEKALSPVEQTRLGDLESVIRENFLAYVAVGNALLEIRESRLYRTDDGRTWEGYCREIWDMGYKYADKLVSASKVIENLTPIGVKADGTIDWELLPANESQARELARLAPEEQKQVWQQLIKGKQAAAGDESPARVTAKAVKNAVKGFKGEHISDTIKKSRDKVKDKVNPDKSRKSAEFSLAWENLMEEIDREHRSGWKNTPRDTVFNSLISIAQAVGEGGKQTVLDRKITLKASNLEKFLGAGFGIYRLTGNKMIEQLESVGTWTVYGEYGTDEQCAEVFDDLLLDPKSIQA